MDAEHWTAKYKNLMARQYDAIVKPRRFNIGDLVLKKVFLATKDPSHGKLGPNWEGPYRIINCRRQGSYYLKALDGRKLEHALNVEHLRRYYSKSKPGRVLLWTSWKFVCTYVLLMLDVVFNTVTMLFVLCLFML